MSGPAAPATWPRTRVAAWVLYDLANTVYPATLTFLFQPWFEQTFDALTAFGVVNATSMLASGLLVPMFGALLDRTGRTRGYLAVATLVCIGAIAGFGLGLGKAWLLGCFFAANLAYNVALLFYNALLPSVAPPERTGRVSGLGVGVGYFGTILVLVALAGSWLGDVPARCPLAAALFLGFALPCLLLVRDRRPRRGGPAGSAMLDSLRTLGTALRELPRHRALLWFLLANFCFVDVLNTAVLYFAGLTRALFRDAATAGTLSLLGHPYVGDAGLDAFVQHEGLLLNGLALVFGIALGRLTDRRPLLVMAASAVALLIALAGGALFGGTHPLGFTLTLVLCGSFGLCGVWTAGRQVVLVLAPPDRVGEYFGLYGITNKLSMLGAVVYAVVRDHAGHPQALLAQSPQLCLGLVFLLMVRLPRRPAATA